MGNRLFIVTGDHSGDIHAGNLARALYQKDPTLEIAAVGGENLRAAGVELLHDQSNMGKMGLSLFAAIPSHLLLGLSILRFLKTFQPDAVLLIDYGVFNLQLARHLKQAGYRVLYFIPPQVWASRRKRIEKIKAYVDHVFCIFPFEEALYHEEGIPVTFVGHPLVGQLPAPAEKTAFCLRHGLDPDKPILGFFPGSRKMEIQYLLPALMEAAERIQKVQPDLQIALSQAGSLPDAFFNTALHKAQKGGFSPSFHIVKGDNHGLLSVADLAVVASGTVTLEAALYGTPMVIIYKASWMTYQAAKRLCYLPCLGLPNILTDVYHPIVPELLQQGVTGANIAETALSLLPSDDSPVRTKMLAGLAQIKDTLGSRVAIDCVASEILNQIHPYNESKFPLAK